MKVDGERLGPAEIRAAARAWYQRQLAILAEVHGRQWPEQRAWIESYLQQELRQRLEAIGWRRKS